MLRPLEPTQNFFLAWTEQIDIGQLGSNWVCCVARSRMVPKEKHIMRAISTETKYYYLISVHPEIVYHMPVDTR